MNIKALLHPKDSWIFDLDGVLVDSYECWYRMLKDVRKDQGSELDREEFDRSWGQGPEADQKMFFPGWQLSEVLEFYDTNFHKYTEWVRCDAQAVELLKLLKERGKKTGVASNSTGTIIRTLLQESGALNYVDAIVGIDEVAESKPAPDLIYKAIEKLKTTAGKTCFMGDSVYDQQAAAAACVLFIGYRREGEIHIENFTDLFPFL